MRSGVPFFCDQLCYVADGVSDLYDAKALVGCGFGTAAMLHRPSGAHFRFGKHGSDAPPAADIPALARRVTDVHSLAMHAPGRRAGRPWQRVTAPPCA
jgi:hypothetical protein